MVTARLALGGGAMPDFDAPYIQRGVVELLLLAVIAGVLGTWIVLRRLPFYTHAIGTAAFPGLVVAGPWGMPAQVAALGARWHRRCASARSGVRAGSTRTPRSDCCWWPPGARGGPGRDVYESGAGVDRLLFGSLIAPHALDLWLTAAAAVAPSRRTARCSAPGWRPASTPTAPALGVRTAARTVLLFAVASRPWSRSTRSARCWSPSS